jgi:shikimate dehydrogenase
MLTIDGETKYYLLLGNPVAQSLSPAMYNAAFEHLRVNCAYLACQVREEGLSAAVAGLKSLGIKGGNVTVPYKERIIPYLDGITEEARLMGAVNTLFYRDDKLWGTNTDGPGFIKALAGLDSSLLGSSSALILGAGGAARAVVISLALNKIPELILVNRNKEKALALAKIAEGLGSRVSVLDWESPDLREATEKSPLIINTTSLGMYPRTDECPPLDTSLLGPGQTVVDIIYKPKETVLLKRAKARGCRTMNGLSMLLEQGVLSFEQWSDYQAPVAIMKSELVKRVR